MNRIFLIKTSLKRATATTATATSHRQYLHSEQPFYGSPRSSSSAHSTTSFSHHPIALLLQNAVTALRDPTRADAVAAVGELTGRRALRGLLETMRADPVGQRILADRPVVSKATIPYEKLLEGEENDKSNNPNAARTTFGQAYGAFLRTHGFDPDERDAVRYLENEPDLQYVMLRYRQCHDYWHALTDLPPTVPGELGLKWLELFQTGLPLAAFSSTVGSLRLSPAELEAVWKIYLPWALRQKMPFGKLMCVYYEEEWDTPVAELRARLQLEPAPQVDV